MAVHWTHPVLTSALAAVLCLTDRPGAGADWSDWIDAPIPPVPVLRIDQALYDPTPVDITITAFGQQVPRRVTGHALRSDITVWQRMHVADWNRVPERLRHAGLDAMIRRHRAVITSPAAWARMSAFDWDDTPQPVRVLACLRMVDYWTAAYGVGAEHGLQRRDVAAMLAAIVMTESWFDHRAVNVGYRGRLDLGLAQASRPARERMRRLYEVGIADTYLSDEDYFNPWHATRFVAMWTSLLLDQVGGDLAMAVRAYHRGVARATDEAGDRYLETVRSRLRRFVLNLDSTPAWDYLWKRNTQLEAEQWVSA